LWQLARIELLLLQIANLEAERNAAIKPDAEGRPSPIALLTQLKAIGPQIGAVLYHEGLYRNFTNRRDVAAYAGLVSTPWRSSSIDREHVKRWEQAARNWGRAFYEDRDAQISILARPMVLRPDTLSQTDQTRSQKSFANGRRIR
jgi:transposase